MLKKEFRINRAQDYNDIFKNGKKYIGKHIIVFMKGNNLNNNRFGIVTSKKIGNAVIRNRAKRRIRAVIQQESNKLNNSYDIVIIGRVNIKNVSFEAIKQDFLYIMKKGKLC